MGIRLTGINFSLFGLGVEFTWNKVDTEKGEIEFSEEEQELIELLAQPRAILNLFPKTKTGYEKIQIKWDLDGKKESAREETLIAFKELKHHKLIIHKEGVEYELSPAGRKLAKKIKEQK